jgi:hypothetical protein
MRSASWSVAKMMSPSSVNSASLVVAGHIEPIPPHRGFIARVLYVNYLMWNAIVNPLSGGDHIHNLQGPATLIRGDFARSVAYPVGITCDEGFLYVMAKRKNGFRFAQNTKCLTVPLTTVNDIRVGAKRYLNERYGLVPYFGKEILEWYNVPFVAKVRGIALMLAHRPIATIGALFYNVWMKIALTDIKVRGSGVWERIESTQKKATPTSGI